MSKERPIKSFRLEGERPFKTYNLGISSLFVDSQRFEQQQISLQTSASNITQQQHQLRLRHQQNSLPIQLNQRLQLAYNNDPTQYLRFRAQFQQGSHNSPTIPQNINYHYDDVSQDSPANHNNRSDLAVSNESSFHHGGLDLNVTSQDSSLQSFLEPKGNSYRTTSNGSLGDHDTLSMLFEHPLQFLNNGLPRSTDNATYTNCSPFLNSQLSEGLSMPFNNTAAQGSGINRNGRAMVFSENPDNLPVKQEFINDGDFVTTERQDHSINSSRERSGENCRESFKYNHDFSAASTPTADTSTMNSTDKLITCNDYQSDKKGQGETSKYQTYLEKRKKNNESAKRSREARRTKEELVALRVIGLEEENMKLQAEICMLDRELDELRTQLYQCN